MLYLLFVVAWTQSSNGGSQQLRAPEGTLNSRQNSSSEEPTSYNSLKSPKTIHRFDSISIDENASAIGYICSIPPPSATRKGVFLNLNSPHIQNLRYRTLCGPFPSSEVASLNVISTSTFLLISSGRVRICSSLDHASVLRPEPFQPPTCAPNVSRA